LANTTCQHMATDGSNFRYRRQTWKRMHVHNLRS